MTREGEEAANRAVKIRIYPNAKQEKQIKRNLQAARVAYNFAVDINLKEYEEWAKVKAEYRQTLDENLSKQEVKDMMYKFAKENKRKYISSPETISKMFTQEKKTNPEYLWVQECSSQATAFVFRNMYKKGIDKFEKGYEKNRERVDKKKKKDPSRIFVYPKDYGFPKFKKYSEATSHPTEIKVHHIDRENHRIFIPQLGWVRVSRSQEIPYFLYPSQIVANPVVSTDGRGYYLSFGYYNAFMDLDKPQTDVLGVDLGMKNLAALSDGTIVSNFADDKLVKKYESQIKKMQKELSKLIDKGKSAVYKPYIITKEELEAIPKNLRGKKLAELSRERNKLSTNKVRKLRRLIRKKQIRINNRKSYLLHTTCEDIVRKNPEDIIFEDLNIAGMFKNKKWANKLQRTGMYKFKECLLWHAKKHNITCKQVSRYYASSQMCSACGEINEAMKDLNKRTFVCPSCGHTMDRDINAGINLKKIWNNKDIKIIS